MAENKGERQQPPPPPPPSRPKVKSYLHKFYDRSQPTAKDPALSEPGSPAVAAAAAAGAAAATADEEDELRRLLSGGGGVGGRGGGRSSKQSGCHLRPVVWKAMLWIGINCLIFGALGLAIAFFLPHEPEFVEVPGAQGFVRSRSNADWNRSASILKYVALSVFGVGAVVTAAGLVLPSLVWRLFDQEDSSGGGGGGTMTLDSCSSRCRRRQQPRTMTTSASVAPAAASAAVATAVAATTPGAAAMAEAPPALSSLVDEQPVQPPRGPEGHVSHGQVK